MNAADAAGDVRTALVAVAVARDNLGLLLKMWSAPGRPAWWTGETRWTPPPDPAAATQALTDRLRDACVDLTEDEKATIRGIVMARRERYLAAEREKAEAKMRSYLPPPGPDGNGDGPR